MTRDIMKHAVMILGLVGGEEELSSPTLSRFRDMHKSLSKKIQVADSFDSVFASSSDDAKDLLRKMLMIDPEKRITIDDALKHSYFASYEDELEDLED